jgi:hypothetical protein
LTIEAHDDATKHTVEVQVWEKLPSNVKDNELPIELTNFKIVEGDQQVNITGSMQQSQLCCCDLGRWSPGQMSVLHGYADEAYHSLNYDTQLPVYFNKACADTY